MNPSTVASLYSVFLKAEGYSNISLLDISLKDKKYEQQDSSRN